MARAMEAGPSQQKSLRSAATTAGSAATSTTGADPPSHASPATTPSRTGPSPYHDSSQFRHWRYSETSLVTLRAALNERSKEVTAKNMAAEKEAQMSLGGAVTDPPAPAAYLSVDDELLLVRFYCNHASKICRQGFGLPEDVEATAISYMKRFYLKNSVMEWHPKNIMPTCLFLAAKTTNHPVPIETYVSKLQGFQMADVLDLEFLVAQSLGFEFWVRGANKALRGWALELQTAPAPPSGSSAEAVQRALPAALEHLATSRYTDTEFLYAPSQIALACWRLANKELVDSFLELKYSTAKDDYPYGISLPDLSEIITEIETHITDAAPDFDIRKVKEIDKRLKSCTNPEKVQGTALYIKRKAEQEAKAAESKAVKTAKAKEARAEDDLVFGGSLKGSASKDADVFA